MDVYGKNLRKKVLFLTNTKIQQQQQQQILLTIFFSQTRNIHTVRHVYVLYAHTYIFLLFCIFNINGFDKKKTRRREENKKKNKTRKEVPHSLTMSSLR